MFLNASVIFCQENIKSKNKLFRSDKIYKWQWSIYSDTALWKFEFRCLWYSNLEKKQCIWLLDYYPVTILVPPLFTIYGCAPVCSPCEYHVEVRLVMLREPFFAYALPFPGILGLGNPLFFILHMFKALLMCMSLIWKIILKTMLCLFPWP